MSEDPTTEPRLRRQAAANNATAIKIFGASFAVMLALAANAIVLRYDPSFARWHPITEVKQPEVDRGPELNELRAAIRSVEATLRAAPSDAPSAALMAVQAGELERLRTRVDQLESAILANPVKALQMVLLQRDLEAMKAVHAASVSAVQAAEERTYDMMKWVVGLFAACIISLAVTTFWTRAASTKRE